MKTYLTIFCTALLAITAHAQQPAPLEFLAKDAKITAAGSFMNFESKPEFQNIGGWNNTNASVKTKACGKQLHCCGLTPTSNR